MTAYSVSRVRRSLIYFSIGKGLGVVLGIGTLLTLVRALEIEAYSFYILSQALLPLIDQLTSLGLGAMAQRYIPELFSQSEGRKLAKLTLLLCFLRISSLFVSAILLYIFAEYLLDALSMIEMVEPFRLFLLVIFFELFARYLNIIFDSLLLQGVSQILLLLRSGLRVIPVLLLLLSGEGPIALTTWIYIDATAAILGCVWGTLVLLLFMRKTVVKNPGTDHSLEIKRYFRYSVPFYLGGNISILSSQNTIKIIAAKVLNVNQFATFGFSISLITTIQRYMPMFLLMNMIGPLFVSARQRVDYKTRIPELAMLILKLNLFALVPLMVVFIVYSEVIANLITGGRYPDAGNYIVAFLPILLTQTLRNIAILISQAMENSRAPLFASMLSLFGLLLGLILSEYIGAYGFCIGLVLSDLIFTSRVLKVVAVNQLIFKIEWTSYIKFLVMILVATIILYVISDLTGIDSIISMLTAIVAVFVIYLLFAFILKPFSQIERDIINKIFKRNVFVW